MRKILALLVLTAAVLMAAPVAHADRSHVVPGSPESVILGCVYNVPQLHGKAGPYLVWDGPNGEYVTIHNYIQVIRSTNCPDSVRAYTAWHFRKNGQPINGGAKVTHSVEGANPPGQFAITPVENFGSTGPDGEGSTVSAWLAVSDVNDGYRGWAEPTQVTVAGVPSGSNHFSTSGWIGFP